MAVAVIRSPEPPELAVIPVNLLPSPSKKLALTPMLAVISPTSESAPPSKVRSDSQVYVFESPATFVTKELLVAFVIRGTLMIAEPSEVLRLPDTIFSTIKSPGKYFVAAITVPDSVLYAIVRQSPR